MSLEFVVAAVEEARLARLAWQVLSDAERWLRERQHGSGSEVLASLSVGGRAAAVVDPGPVVVAFGEFDSSLPVAVTYVAEREEPVTYLLDRPGVYARLAGYRVPERNQFYVHVPPGASVRSATADELGAGVLGTAHMVTGEIRLLESLDPAERTEVLLHESLHLLYPQHSERQIRDLVRTVMGKQYCRFH